MVESKIKWSKNAEIDLFETLKFYTQRNKSTIYSKTILKEVTDSTINLLTFPMLGRPYGKLLRILVVMNYNIYYQVQKDLIEIHLFWDTRRNPAELEISLKRIKLYE